MLDVASGPRNCGAIAKARDAQAASQIWYVVTLLRPGAPDLLESTNTPPLVRPQGSGCRNPVPLVVYPCLMAWFPVHAVSVC